MTTHTIRATDAMDRQIEALKAAGHGNVTQVVKTAIDRMYREETSMLANRVGIVAGDTPAVMVGKVREFCTTALPGETPAYVATQALMMWAGICATQGIADVDSAFAANYGPGALPAIERRNKRLS